MSSSAVSGSGSGSFEACAAPARAEESGRFVLTSRFSWAIESLSPGRAGLRAGLVGLSDSKRLEPERDELGEREEREIDGDGREGRDARGAEEDSVELEAVLEGPGLLRLLRPEALALDALDD